jgi:signal peptidase II
MDFKVAKWIWLAVAVVLVVAADQAAKAWAASRLARPDRGYYPPPCNPDGPIEERVKMNPVGPIRVLEDYWHFRYVENCGGAFGFLSGQQEKYRRPFFYITSILASIFLVYLLIRLKESEKVLLAAFSVILGGAVGNVIDRVRLGYVVDFIDWHIRDRARWPTFNIADVGITVGLLLILVDSFFLAPKREKKAKKEKDKKDRRGKRKPS